MGIGPQKQQLRARKRFGFVVSNVVVEALVEHMIMLKKQAFCCESGEKVNMLKRPVKKKNNTVPKGSGKAFGRKTRLILV